MELKAGSEFPLDYINTNSDLIGESYRMARDGLVDEDFDFTSYCQPLVICPESHYKMREATNLKTLVSGVQESD